jgi:hypothetical protein
MKRQLLIVGAGIVLLLGHLAAANSARAATTVKKSTPTVRADTFKGKVSHSDTTQAQPVTGQTVAVQPSPQTPARATASANYQIPWLSINSSGGPAASTNYQTNVTVGQATVGTSSSANYTVGQGFWYGASGGCDCPHQGDITSDAVIDVFDVIGLIDIAFSGGTDIHDPGCPTTRADVDNNGVADVFDVIYIIATAFSGGPNPVDPCNP